MTITNYSLTGVTLTATSGTSTTVIGTQTIPLSSLSLGANTVQITPGSSILTALQSGATVTPSLNVEYANGLSVVSTAGAPYVPRVQDHLDELSWIPAPALTPTVVYNVIVGTEPYVSTYQYTNGVGITYEFTLGAGTPSQPTAIPVPLTLTTNSNINNVQWSVANNNYMSITSSGGTVNMIGGGAFYEGGTQTLYFTIPQTTFNNVTYAAFSGSINVTSVDET